MDTIEIKDDEIDVEEIMRQIRKNIRKRKESGIYSKEMEALINEPLQPPPDIAGQGDLLPDLMYINSNWDVHAEYSISSHRPIIGNLLVSGRRLIHEEVKRYVDPIAGKEIEFNAHVVRCINGLDTKINEAVAAVNKDIDFKVGDAMASVNKDIDLKVDDAVTAKVNEAMNAINKDIENKAWLANLLEQRIKKNITTPLHATDNVMNYFLFEEKFRGSMEDIKKRQSIFLEYFKNSQNVLDIGCGRGEFLTLLKENGIGARGIDLNEDMVLYCQKNGLDVSQNNALSYLKSIKDKSLDGVFSGQVVEHLQPDELINLVKLCYDKMKFGTYFIAETMNPMCLSIFATYFYMDLSHLKPVHPETIKFLLESVGFRDIQFKFFSPFPETAKLSKLEITNNISSEDKARLEMMNQNIDKLNALLYGYLDYAVIGKK